MLGVRLQHWRDGARSILPCAAFYLSRILKSRSFDSIWRRTVTVLRQTPLRMTALLYLLLVLRLGRRCCSGLRRVRTGWGLLRSRRGRRLRFGRGGRSRSAGCGRGRSHLQRRLVFLGLGPVLHAGLLAGGSRVALFLLGLLGGVAIQS